MYSSVNFPVQPHVPLVKSDSPQAIASAESNGKVQGIPASLRHLPDSTESPEHPLDKRQITTQTSCVVKAGPEQPPTKFQENDLLLVYPCNSHLGRVPGLDLEINPEKLKNSLEFNITEFLRKRWIDGKREDGPTEDETKSLADSILARLPAELTEFLNKDWSGKELFAPEEYQALARFHSAMILAKHERINYFFAFVNDEECEDVNDFIVKNNIPLSILWSKDDEEFHEFFNKECMPLRDGWSLDEIKIIRYWLKRELSKPVKTCHYGILKAGCVTVCDNCKYSVIENWEMYERFKMFMRQKQKLS
ncbi:hypothetical protein ACTL6P_23475 [Endozoicomonas acroporae]|uniref:hypothetical protein n=1 Tax=Endozoicomonas acroporae TaxID=1701104 RepID=UPI000C78F60C|nr:hypothetical protein [Endozoicomonas acroporae]